MIFVTVGTHEQQFDRLVKGMDQLKKEKIINDEIFIQTGYSNCKPGFCEYRDFIPFAEMMQRMAEADMVVTHGGTGSIMLVLYHQKIPLVMPRQKKYHEHIDDHQVLFCKTMESKGKIIAAYETTDLGPALTNYRQRVQELQQQENLAEQDPAPGLHVNERAAIFAKKLNDICLHLVSKK